MFLRRAIGFIIYFIVISVFRIGSEIINDSLGLDDFLVIVSYSAVSVFVITILVSIIEFLISLWKNKEPRFWNYFNICNSLLVFLVLIILVFMLYLILPSVDESSLVLWCLILFIGETLRTYYINILYRNK